LFGGYRLDDRPHQKILGFTRGFSVELGQMNRAVYLSAGEDDSSQEAEA
jgi:hypothetical protein